MENQITFVQLDAHRNSGSSWRERAIAATLLSTLGLDELIAGRFEEYEDIAVALGHDAEARHALRERLATRRADRPLFDTARWVRDVERAYEAMWSIHRRGEAPRDIMLD